MTRFLNRRRKVFGNIAALLIYSMVFQAVPTVGETTLGFDEDAVLSQKEKKALVEQGILQYEQGVRDLAQQTFEQVKTAFPESDAAPFYLGMIYLEAGQRSNAIAEWQQYVQTAPDSKDSMKIRKYLTLLLREETIADVKQTVADEAALLSGPVADNTVAVTAFSNLGSEALGPLCKGLAAMLISDLSQVPDLKVVERVKLHALLQELDLGLSGIVDPETVPRVGKLLKSKHVATGSLTDPEKERLQIFSAVMDTEQPDQIDTQEVQGVMDEFFNLEKQIACGIIEALGRNCDSMPDAFNKIHTRSLTALTSYGIGLDYFDREQYENARMQFQKAVDEDPKFDLAKDALLAIPLTTMLLMTVSQMVSSVSGGITSSTATAGAATTAGGGMGTTGITTVTIAGAAAVAGAAAALGGGGSDDPNPDPIPPADLDLNGAWIGTWIDTNGENLIFRLEITQTNTSISGTAEITGYECSLSGSLSGTIEGSSLQVTITGTGMASISAMCSNSTINGSFDITSGDCSGYTGNLSLLITERTTISW